MHADRKTLHDVLQLRTKMYKLEHSRDMKVRAVSHMLSRTLYYKRFFPYYAFNVLGGVDEETNEGFIYGYDAIGSFEEERYSINGSGATLAHPLMDNQLRRQHQTDGKGKKLGVCQKSKEEAVQMVKNMFNAI